MTHDHRRPNAQSPQPTDGTVDEPVGAELADSGELAEASSGELFPIVGIGASAGGLEAFTELLQHLPLDTGMGFVLVQHLDPQHDSALTELLSRATEMPVNEVTNDLRVEPDHIYIIPPNKSLVLAGGLLKLQTRNPARTPFRSIDSFFESLAQDCRERAIGVVLSGTASDGTLGLEAIKAEGGITFVQDESARYDSMPRSAVAAGCVDFVLSPEKIAEKLAQVARHPFVAGRSFRPASVSDDQPIEATADGYQQIILLLRNHCGVDFSLYKSSTIQRRIDRRIVLGKHTCVNEYAQALSGNAKELDSLYSDLLISVTSFFRNPEAFEFLKLKVFPHVLPERGDGPFRIWTLGCSTGQEAYSLAMAFTEFADNVPHAPQFQLFATDVNDALLRRARGGLYPKSITDEISAERLQRFFVEETGGYRVIKSLRESIVFARQNFLNDPPFSRMNLISCRNLLIYIEGSLQKKVIPTFHYALAPKGCLFLGTSESISGYTDLFEPFDKKHKIYLRKPGASPAIQSRLSPSHSSVEKFGAKPLDALEGFHPEVSAQREAERITRSRYAPPSVLINDDFQVIEFRGDTSAYLKSPSGPASFGILKMARDGLMLPLHAALTEAKDENQAVRKENLRLDHKGQSARVNFEVVPLKNIKERCYLVFFEDQLVAAPAAIAPPEPTGEPFTAANAEATATAQAQRIVELETDLAETRDYLQSLQEQHDAAHEELQSSNEESTSANEELKSINEELETSKEELESTNEELCTVNEELANRNADLNRLNSDLENLQTSTRLCIVLLGRDLCIRRFSAQAETQFSLLATDVGRPIGDVNHNLVINGAGRDQEPAVGQPANLEHFIGEVINDVREREWEVRDTKGRWYSLRVRPYMTMDNQVDGAVLVLVDIESLKRGELAIAAARDYAEAIVRTAPDPLLILNADLSVHTANEAFYNAFKVSAADSLGCSVFDLGDGQWNIPKLRELLADILPRQTFFNNFEITHDFETIGHRTMLLNARTLSDRSGQPARILLGIQDISELLYFQSEMRRSEQRYRRLFEAAKDGVLLIHPTTHKILEANPVMSEMLGCTHDELPGQELIEIGLFTDQAASVEAFRELEANGFFRDKDFSLESRTGQRREVAMVCNLYQENGEKIIQCNIRDITERKRNEEELLASHARFKALFDASPVGMYLVDAELRIQLISPKARPAFGESDAMIGRDFIEVVHSLWPPVSADEITAHFRHTLATGEPYSAPEFSLEMHAGKAQEYYDWQIHRITLPCGNYGVVCYFLDITERMRLTKELQRHADELFEVDRRKNEFIAMLAHELRNPLAPIRNALEVMRLTNGNAEAVASASVIMERQVAQMVRLVDDLLDASRISRGKIELRRGRIELASAIHHAVAAVHPLVQSMEHELSVTLPPEPVFLNADPARLGQVVGNLLNNACKFTDRGGKISLRVECADGYAVIRVRDSGVGIAAEQLPHIFEMFLQVDTSLERSVSGLGIGLALVKSLVELHGGTVEVFSDGIGHGSEFVVRLPMLDETIDVAQPDMSLTAPRTAASTTARRILVVDDNRDSATTLAALLRFKGHETHVAHDGAEAVATAEQTRPELMLLDIGLPKMNGYEVARQIREQPWGQEMVIVALTGWGQDQDRQKSRDAGFNGHLVKPMEITTLMNLLDDLPKRD